MPFPDPLPKVAQRILNAQEALSDASTATATLMALPPTEMASTDVV
jgi:hypothetical protein